MAGDRGLGEVHGGGDVVDAEGAFRQAIDDEDAVGVGQAAANLGVQPHHFFAQIITHRVISLIYAYTSICIYYTANIRFEKMTFVLIRSGVRLLGWEKPPGWVE